MTLETGGAVLDQKDRPNTPVSNPHDEDSASLYSVGAVQERARRSGLTEMELLALERAVHEEFMPGRCCCQRGRTP